MSYGAIWHGSMWVLKEDPSLLQIDRTQSLNVKLLTTAVIQIQFRGQIK